MSIKIALVGVGNCAKSLIEGIGFYLQQNGNFPGLMHPTIGRYKVTDLEFVSAFDVDKRKVGIRLDHAIEAAPNRTLSLAEPCKCDVIVNRGPTLDSIIPELRSHFIHESDENPVDVASVLRESGAEVVVSYLPTGSDEASYAYAEAALEAGCSYINCMPTALARDPKWQDRFSERGLVLLGDDIKSQCGATIVNRALLRLFGIRGVNLTESEQVNYGGNADHFNLQYRAHSKESSKEAALESVLDTGICKPIARMIYTEENYDHKRAEISLKGHIFGASSVTIRVQLDDEDSPNSSGVVVDAIRSARLLAEANMPHKAAGLSSFLMKAPPQQSSDEKALLMFEQTVEEASLAVSNIL